MTTLFAVLGRGDGPEHLTAWHRFSDDARLGRARAWLADQGYEPTPR